MRSNQPYGMPKEAAKRGAVEKTVALDQIGWEIAAFAG
jgi:chemotaxis response regulator CheB